MNEWSNTALSLSYFAHSYTWFGTYTPFRIGYISILEKETKSAKRHMQISLVRVRLFVYKLKIRSSVESGWMVQTDNNSGWWRNLTSRGFGMVYVWETMLRAAVVFVCGVKPRLPGCSSLRFSCVNFYKLAIIPCTHIHNHLAHVRIDFDWAYWQYALLLGVSGEWTWWSLDFGLLDIKFFDISGQVPV